MYRPMCAFPYKIASTSPSPSYRCCSSAKAPLKDMVPLNSVGMAMARAVWSSFLPGVRTRTWSFSLMEKIWDLPVGKWSWWCSNRIWLDFFCLKSMVFLLEYTRYSISGTYWDKPHCLKLGYTVYLLMAGLIGKIMSLTRRFGNTHRKDTYKSTIIIYL